MSVLPFDPYRLVGQVDLALSRHANMRTQQRGFREKDFDILLKHGSEVGNGMLMLTDTDVQHAIHRMKYEISQLDRLRGMTAVIADGRVVTVYKAHKPLRQRARRRRN